MQYILFISSFIANFPTLKIMSITIKYFYVFPIAVLWEFRILNTAKEYRMHFYLYILYILATFENLAYLIES